MDHLKKTSTDPKIPWNFLTRTHRTKPKGPPGQNSANDPDDFRTLTAGGQLFASIFPQENLQFELEQNRPQANFRGRQLISAVTSTPHGIHSCETGLWANIIVLKTLKNLFPCVEIPVPFYPVGRSTWIFTFIYPSTNHYYPISLFMCSNAEENT